MRLAAKRDAVEPAIVAHLTAKGAEILKLSAPGYPDLVVCYRGRVFLMEVKSPGGKVTPAQRMTFDDLEAVGVHVHVVTTPAEAWDIIRGN